jgi:hypothetical protein
MDDKALVAFLTPEWGFQPGNRHDVEWIGARNFRITEVRPDLTVVQTVSGYVPERGIMGRVGVVSMRNPVLTLEQARVYDQAVRRFDERLNAAELDGKQEALLWGEGEGGELFHPLHADFPRAPNLYSSAVEGMLPVLHALDDYAKLREKQIVPMKRGDEPWEVWARPFRSRM